MSVFLKFLRQKSPRHRGSMPQYYQSALASCELILSVYFGLAFFLFPLLLGRWIWVPGAFLAATLLCTIWRRRLSEVRVNINLAVHALVILGWCAWHTYFLGWNCGAQLLIIPILMLCFFDVFMPPWRKLLYFLLLVLYWMGLYYYALHVAPVCSAGRFASIIFQTANSLALFVIMAFDFIVFSSSIQKTELKLLLANQELQAKAATDPLTQLPNRRSMLERIDRYLQSSENKRFSVAIADIDFFKKVNDTYGHDGGDYTLRELSALYRNNSGEDYWICRWGGEEFCFFLPGKNLDEAAAIMFRLANEVRRMPLTYKGASFSITITVGVAENDYSSSLEDIIKEADEKLYRGKMNGRNQVVF